MRALVVTLLLFLTACVGSPLPATNGLAPEALDALQVATISPSGYDRDDFGPAWKDTDHNGCDNRSDVIRRDMHIIRTKEGTRGCIVQTGDFWNPYTNIAKAYERGPDSGIEIDHVVSLHNGWESGLDDEPGLRVFFANDPLNLITTDRASNRTKSDKAADRWLVPDNPQFRCDFAARQVSVKKKYNLSVTPAELQALRTVLNSCENQPLITDAAVAPPRAFPIGEPRR